MRLWPLLLMAASLCAVNGTPFLEEYIFGAIKRSIAQKGGVGGQSWSYCLLCKSVISIIQEFFSSGKSEDELVSVLIFGCKTLKVESAAVCEGIIPRFRGMLFEVVRKSRLSTHDMCSLAFEGQCGKTSEFVDWNINVTLTPKPPIKDIPLPDPKAPKIRIAQLADTHEDPDYVPGAQVDCGDPLCCRERSTVKQLSTGEVAGFWGSYLRCDIPERTVEATLEFMANSVRPDVIYWTGDIMPHNVWESSREENIQQFNRTVQLLRRNFPNIKVIPVMGNHEGVPVNSFAIPEVTGEYSISWLYNALADVWSYYIPEENLKTFRQGGYFSYDLYPKLRLISLNMNYCNNFNWWLLINSQDPTGQLAWLTTQLEECESKGINVHILAHIPPGRSDCLPVWSRNFNDILNRFESTIVGQFYGHTHHEEFTVFFDKENTTRPYSVGFIAPSLTTYDAGDPAFRVYSIDGNYKNSTFQVLDYETYFMDLNEANLHPNESYVPEWDLLPSMKEVYNLQSMQAEEWAKLAELLKTNDDVFEDFYKLYMKRLPNAAYTGQTRRQIICQILTTRSGTACDF